MNKELVPPELYFELRDLGIEPYSFVHKAELEQGIFYSQAFRWFREKYGMLYTIEENLEDDQVWYEWDVKSSNGFEGSFEATYEEAELACLKKLIEIAKNKQL
jgi:hypothetical protein